jgi:hypothetical protein
MAGVNITVPIIDDVTGDEELVKFFNTYRTLYNNLTNQHALAATQIKAMLRVFDKKSGKRRAHKVSRPMLLCTSLTIAAAKLCAMAAQRFINEYEVEIAAARQRQRAASRFRFGDQ